MKKILFVLCISLWRICYGQFDPDAGLVLGWEKYPGVSISATSVEAQSVAALAIDTNTSTAWTSVYCASTTSNPCPCQSVIINLGAERNVGYFIIRTWNSWYPNVTISISTDNTTWSQLFVHPAPAFRALHYPLGFNRRARFVKVEECVNSTAGQGGKAVVYDVQIFDMHGEWGASPVPNNYINPNSFYRLMGVNGIWNWGSQTATPNGPGNYTKICSIARNYHNLGWDIGAPNATVNWSNLNVGSWLNWTVEYLRWRGAGFTELTTSIQFSNANEFAVARWTNPYQNAYNYGQSFANYFRGRGVVTYAEVGNEPWDFPAPFYREVLLGMSRGFKDGDSNLIVMPGALQAHYKEFPNDYTSAAGHYIGSRVNATHLQYLDALNVHTYSVYNGPGETQVTYPEDPRSAVHQVRNMVRWRNANAPGKPVLLTEWGWDGASIVDNPPCLSGPYHNVCTTAEGKALYAMRGLLLFAREGMDRAIWYFYANLGGNTPLFDRSGLLSSQASNFRREPVWDALDRFLTVFGNLHYVGLIREDLAANVYLIGHANGTVTHIVAWKPVPVEDETFYVMRLQIPTRFVPISTENLVRLRGLDQGVVNTSVTDYGNGTWSVRLSKNILVIPVSDHGQTTTSTSTTSSTTITSSTTTSSTSGVSTTDVSSTTGVESTTTANTPTTTASVPTTGEEISSSSKIKLVCSIFITAVIGLFV